MDKLVALPVSGDAFLLRRGWINILVDGGRSSRVLIKALSDPKVAVNHLHIVACTHADIDHAGGLTDLLEKSSVRVDEFWLPGAWSDLLPELLQSPQQVVEALVAELERFEPFEVSELDHDDNDRFESHVHARVAQERQQIQRKRGCNESRADPEEQDNVLDPTWLKEQAGTVVLDAANDEASARVFHRGRRLVRYRASKMMLDRRWGSFWISLIDTAERIRKIAVQAIRRDVKVRWFDFGEFYKTRQASGGQPGLLIPLNAIELLVPPPPRVTLSYMARLTPVNEECLVFMAPPTGNSPYELGVIFTGDSPLGDGPAYSHTWLDVPQKPWQYVVVTAPHHGSESNAMAYGHLRKIACVSLWLRSGGSKNHPGQTFRGLPPHMRACTHCPYRMLKRDLAEVQLSRFLPIFRVRAHDCNCHYSAQSPC